jgi:hypothetical protein
MPGTSKKIAPYKQRKICLSAAKDSPALSDRMVEFDSDPELPDE